jgi:hypothetical protein
MPSMGARRLEAIVRAARRSFPEKEHGEVMGFAVLELMIERMC